MRTSDRHKQELSAGSGDMPWHKEAPRDDALGSARARAASTLEGLWKRFPGPSSRLAETNRTGALDYNHAARCGTALARLRHCRGRPRPTCARTLWRFDSDHQRPQRNGTRSGGANVIEGGHVPHAPRSDKALWWEWRAYTLARTMTTRAAGGSNPPSLGTRGQGTKAKPLHGHGRNETFATAQQANQQDSRAVTTDPTTGRPCDEVRPPPAPYTRANLTTRTRAAGSGRETKQQTQSKQECRTVQTRRGAAIPALLVPWGRHGTSIGSGRAHTLALSHGNPRGRPTSRRPPLRCPGPTATHRSCRKNNPFLKGRLTGIECSVRLKKTATNTR
jgi:hypothetical protein